jgi:hypothetical protein
MVECEWQLGALLLVHGKCLAQWQGAEGHDGVARHGQAGKSVGPACPCDDSDVQLGQRL